MKTTKLQLSLLALFLGCASLQAQYKWADPLKQDFHTVRGQAWQDELKDSYARLPQGQKIKYASLYGICRGKAQGCLSPSVPTHPK